MSTTADGDRGRSSVVAIFGPTASGKTAVAEAVADLLATEVVSADAMQVYRELPILTNQPTRATRLVGIRSVSEEMSVAEYATLAHAEIDGLVQERGAAVVAGGTGLYLRAALTDLSIPPAPGADVRARWEGLYDRDPTQAFAELERRDPRAAAAVHPHDRRRVVRALELAESGSSLVPDDDRLWGEDVRHPTLLVGLEVPPDDLARRIVKRTDAMFRAGVVEEVRSAVAAGVSRTAEKALGLREIAALQPAEARECLVVRTRRYAAYQRKWLRRLPGAVIVDGTRAPDDLARELVGRVTAHS